MMAHIAVEKTRKTNTKQLNKQKQFVPVKSIYFAMFRFLSCKQIDVIVRLVFGADFSSISYEFCKNVDMTNILRKCIWTHVLRVQMHVGLGDMTSLLYPMFATTGLEIQYFS